MTHQPTWTVPASLFPPAPVHATPAGLASFLVQDLTSLTDVLSSVDDDPWLLDASLDDVHEIAARLARTVKRQALHHPALCSHDSHRGIGDMFEFARTNEIDNYEIYAHDLERHQRRQCQELAITESDADKFAIVKRRRIYIETLIKLCAQVSGIVDLLH